MELKKPNLITKPILTKIAYDDWGYPQAEDDYDPWSKDKLKEIEQYKKLMQDQLEADKRKKLEEYEKKQQAVAKEKRKAETIDMIKTSTPAICALVKRQAELEEELKFAVTLDAYSDGILEKMKEYQANAKKLQEYHLLVVSLAEMKLGY